LEIEALRKDLQAVRERVKTLEAQPKSQGPLGQGTTRLGTGGFTPGQTGGGFGGGAGFTGGGGGGFSGGTGGGFGVPMGSGVGRAKQPDPVAAAQDALEKLRRTPDNKQALEALEKALQLLKEREKKEKPGGSAK
jgi:hypothetical protein